MRIAYFTDTFMPQINGVTNTLEKLGDYLVSKDIKHMFFAPQYLSKIERPLKSPVYRFNSVSFPIYPECRLSIPLYSNLCKAADSFSPDIVHLVTPLGIGLMGLRYARERNIPVVSSFHTNFDIYLKYYRFEYLEEMVWNFFRWFHSFCSVNFCPSHDTVKTLESKGIDNLKIWSRGIDTSKYTARQGHLPSKEGTSSGTPTTFLYVGRLAPEKDLDILMDSIENINRLYPEKARFIIVGDGPMSKKLKAGAPANVCFTGYLRGERLSEAYASADIFVFPSGTETFGNVILEAMASGLPVIGVNSGGVKDNIIHRYNGLLCEPRDTESFTAGIAELLENHRLAGAMSKNAREYTLQKTWDKVFRQLVYDYYSVLKNCRQSLSTPA